MKWKSKQSSRIRSVLLPCTLISWLRRMCFFAARSVEGRWGVSGNTDPINLRQWAQCLLTYLSLVSLPFTWNRLSVSAQWEHTHTHTHVWSPYVPLVRRLLSFIPLDGNINLNPILLPPKQEISLLFVFLTYIIPYWGLRWPALPESSLQQAGKWRAGAFVQGHFSRRRDCWRTHWLLLLALDLWPVSSGQSPW